MTDVLHEPPAQTPPGWEGILAPGETILWQGRPDSRVVWTDLLSFQSLFGLFFAGFAVFWMTMASGISSGFGSRGPGGGIVTLFPLFGIPFLLVGLYMAAGRIFWDAFQRTSTQYTLTDRTAYIATATLGQRRLERHEIGPAMKLTLDDGDPGTVWFASRVVHHKGGWTGTGDDRRYRAPSTSVIPIGFRRISGARQVYGLLAEAMRKRSEANGR